MASLAHVARMRFDNIEYLGLRDRDRPEWGPTAADATLFKDVREATRAAMRLPSRERAFALPSIGL